MVTADGIRQMHRRHIDATGDPVVTIPLNTDISLYSSSRTTVTNSGADAGYTIFTNPDSPGGAYALDTLLFSTNYYKTGATVTAGSANAAGVITFTYN